MRKARFTEHQIIAVLKSVEPDAPSKMSAAKREYLRPRTTTGKQSTAGWKPLISKR